MFFEEAVKWEASALTQQDLKICASLRREIGDMEEIIRRLREKLEGGRMSTLSFTPHSPRNARDMLAPMVGTLLELEDLYKQRAAAFYEHLRRVEIAIASLWKVEVRRIMRLKYILGLTWEEIALKTSYDERWCRELNRRGLKMLGIEKENKA